MSQRVIPQAPRVRKDINTLSTEELDLLVRAFAGIQANEPDLDKPDNPYPKDFFTIAGFHGMPFRGAGYNDPSWWGGYCNHGNVLFPTWHRAYLMCLENALRSVKGCENVSIPYWNELASAEDKSGIPKIFLEKRYTYAGETESIANPLYSYKFQRGVMDRLAKFPDADYSKPKRYETVRYPFSGLVGKDDSAKTGAHNKLMNMLDKGNPGTTTDLLQSNINNWLNGEVENSSGKKVLAGGHVGQYYLDSLLAPNYTVFSNTTSAQRWNDDRLDPLEEGKPGAFVAVIPLEKPHNAMHLAVGGYDIPGIQQDFGFVPDANGDMGENDTASFDPIFYFHHCWIDLVFWAWQLKNGKTEELDIIEHYPGTNSVDNQGPTPGISGGTWLSLDTHLAPFLKDNGDPLISKDVVDIAKLGYSYEGEVVKRLKDTEGPKITEAVPHIRVSGVSRADAKGSFLMSVWSDDKKTGKKELVGLEPVLSRWHVAGCANCSTHLNVSTVIPLRGMHTNDVDEGQFEVLVHTRDRRFGGPSLGGKTPKTRLGQMSQ